MFINAPSGLSLVSLVYIGRASLFGRGIERFSGEVVEAVGEQGEHDVADPVVVEGVVFGEAPELPVTAVLFGVILEAADYYAYEANKASSGDET